MNKINMLKAVYYLYTQVPPERFDMREYRSKYKNKLADFSNPVCNTVGCAAGHLTSIVPKEKIIYKFKKKEIFFYKTLNSILSIDINQYSFLFAGNWEEEDNTLEGACQRILYLLTEKNPNLLIHERNLAYKKINVIETYNKLKSEYEKSGKL